MLIEHYMRSDGSSDDEKIVAELGSHFLKIFNEFCEGKAKRKKGTFIRRIRYYAAANENFFLGLAVSIFY
jgi:hypothetical protein